MKLHRTSFHPGIIPIICRPFGSIIHVILGGRMIFENHPLRQDEAWALGCVAVEKYRVHMHICTHDVTRIT